MATSDDADRATVLETLARYHRAIDTPDWDLLGAVLSEDVGWTVHAASPERSLSHTVAGKTATTALLQQMIGSGGTQHLTSNHLVDIDGATATSESAMLTVYQPALTILASGTVRAKYLRTAAGWRIVSLETDEYVTAASTDALVTLFDSLRPAPGPAPMHDLGKRLG